MVPISYFMRLVAMFTSCRCLTPESSSRQVLIIFVYALISVGRALGNLSEGVRCIQDGD